MHQHSLPHPGGGERSSPPQGRAAQSAMGPARSSPTVGSPALSWGDEYALPETEDPPSNFRFPFTRKRIPSAASAAQVPLRVIPQTNPERQTPKILFFALVQGNGEAQEAVRMEAGVPLGVPHAAFIPDSASVSLSAGKPVPRRQFPQSPRRGRGDGASQLRRM